MVESGERQAWSRATHATSDRVGAVASPRPAGRDDHRVLRLVRARELEDDEVVADGEEIAHLARGEPGRLVDLWTMVPSLHLAMLAYMEPRRMRVNVSRG
jgi:hypothetical protein